MLYREIIAVCSQIHTKHKNTLCGQNVEFDNAKPGGAHSNHWLQTVHLYTEHIHTCTPLSYFQQTYEQTGRERVRGDTIAGRSKVFIVL